MKARVERALKRATDILVAIAGLAVLSPLFLIIATAIKATSRGTILFRQERVGKDGRVFSIFKFRTMIPNAVNHPLGYFTNEHDPRVTPVGRFLRQHSLDEFPQLLNILRGEMSLVGPRPTLPYQVARYSDFQRRRLRMKPGLTGWAQVQGRNALTWPQRIERDVWYVDHWTWGLDLRILVQTAGIVLRHEGINNDGIPDEISRVG